MSSRLMIAAAAGAFSLLVTGPSLASRCTDRIAALEARLDAEGEASAATSSGGQGVAAARESQAMQAENQVEPIAPETVPPFQDKAEEVEVTQEAAEAGGGGDRVMQARATLNEARTLDGRGDSTGCLDMVTQAERQLGPPE